MDMAQWIVYLPSMHWLLALQESCIAAPTYDPSIKKAGKKIQEQEIQGEHWLYN